MNYQPQSFHFEIDRNTGLRVYVDDKLQTLYLNLRTVSKTIWELQTRAEIDLLTAQNNVGASAVKDQTLQTLGIFASKLFEGISIFFKAGTAAAISTMLIGRVLSGVITTLIQESSPNDDLQRKANEIRSGMDAIFNALKKRVDEINSDFESNWNKPFWCDGLIDPSYRGNIFLGEIADINELLPNETSTEWDDFMVFLQKRNLYIIVSKLLGAKWRVKKWPSYKIKDYELRNGIKHHEFDYLQYNPHTDDDFWCQKFVGIPETDFGAYWMLETSTNDNTSKFFADDLTEMCCNKNEWRYKRFSSYWGQLIPFTEGNFYGNYLNHFTLVDSNGDFAPASLTEWLFRYEKGESGIAEKSDVYLNWGLNNLSLFSPLFRLIRRIKNFFTK